MKIILVDRCTWCGGLIDVTEDECGRGEFQCLCGWYGDTIPKDNAVEHPDNKNGNAK